MEHVSEIELIELQTGRLPADRSVEVRAHLDACPDCRRALEGLARTWDALGQWDLPAAPQDLTQSILAAASRANRRGGRLGWPLGPMGLLKAAASILVAVGIGYVAGLWSRPAPTGGADLENEVVASLYLSTLDSGTPAGLAEALFEPPADPTAEDEE